MIRRLQERWQLKNAWQVVIVLIVFACTGFTVMFLKRPVMGLINGSEDYVMLFTIVYYILILPFYFIILLMYGFIFGQFNFFWSFVKRTWSRMSRKKSKIDAE